MEKSSEPVVCTLTTAAAASQTLQWADLGARALSSEELPAGAAMTFPLEIAEQVEAFAAVEAKCCAFLTVTTERGANQIRLEITSENPDGLPVIHAMVEMASS